MSTTAKFTAANKFQAINMRPQGVACYICLLVLSLAPVSNAIAEQINYCGLNLSADYVKNVDVENVKVTLGSEQLILAQSRLGSWLLAKSLQDPARLAKISTKDLSNFLTLCSLSEPLEVSSAALVEIFNRGDSSSFSARDFLALNQGNAAILARAIEAANWENAVREGSKSAGQVALLSGAMSELIQINPNWVKAKSLRLFYLLSEPISNMLLQRVREELDANNFAFLENLGNSLALLGDAQSKETVFFQKAASYAKQLHQDSFDIDSFREVVKSIQANPALLDLLYPKISSRIIIEVQRLLQAQKLQEALTVFTVLLPNRSSPELLVMVQSLLQELYSNPSTPISDEVHNRFEAFSRADNSILQSYQRLLEVSIDQQLALENASESETALRHLLNIRPDPDAANDQIRYRQALAYKQEGLVLMASDKIDQMQTGAGIFQRLRLFLMNGILGPVIVGLSIFSILSLLCFFLYKRGLLPKFTRTVKPKKVPRPAPQEIKPKIEEEIFEEPASSFVRLDPLRAQAPVKYEYEQKVAEFGLAGGASLREIKSAYRSAVKDCHPDLHPNQSRAQTDRFSELTKIYEELMDLRKELGMVD